MIRKSGIFQNLWRINFSLILFEISVMEKIFPSQIFQKVWGKNLILHSFWKIQLFPVILSWIIYENELKTIKYISPTKSIRRENVRQVYTPNYFISRLKLWPDKWYVFYRGKFLLIYYRQLETVWSINCAINKPPQR